MTDQLQGSPVLAEVLGDALPKLERFHAKIAEEGEPRGLIGPRDVDIIWERHILNSAAIVPYQFGMRRMVFASKQLPTSAVVVVFLDWWLPRVCRIMTSR